MPLATETVIVGRGVLNGLRMPGLGDVISGACRRGSEGPFPVLDTLRRITQGLNDASNLDEGLTVVVRGAKEHLAADVCSAYLVDAAGSNFVLMATDGLDPGAVGAIYFWPFKFGAP